VTIICGSSLGQLAVKWAGSGALWWCRLGATLADTAVMNTTGFVLGAREVRCWRSPETSGIVRINCNRSRPIARYEDEIGGVFLSHGVVRASRENRLLLHPRVTERSRIDCYLVALDSAAHGLVDLRSRPFSGHVQLISASGRGRAQQLLILMWPGSKVTTTFGTLELSWILERQKLLSR
jgi:hypothetical protein